MNSHTVFSGKRHHRDSVYKHSRTLDGNGRFQRIKSRCLEKVKRNRKQLISQLRLKRRRSSTASLPGATGVTRSSGRRDSSPAEFMGVASNTDDSSSMQFSQSLTSIIHHSVIQAQGEEDVVMGAGGGGGNGGSGTTDGACLSSDEQIMLLQLLEETIARELQMEADCRQLEWTERAEGEYLDGAVSSLLLTSPNEAVPLSSQFTADGSAGNMDGGGAPRAPSPQIICPSCQQSYLHASPSALTCPLVCCPFRLPSRAGTITLHTLQQRLEKCCGRHSSRCAAPFVPVYQHPQPGGAAMTAVASAAHGSGSSGGGFSLVTRIHEGTVYLVLECTVCGTREIVV